MDSAFGEDIPSLGGFGEDDDEGMVIGPAHEKPAPAPRTAEDEQWEEEFNRLKEAQEQEEREARKKPTKKAAEPAPKPKPAAAQPAAPIPAAAPAAKKILPLKIEEDWTVTEKREGARPEPVWDIGGQSATLFPGKAEDEDFFSLVTEELYMHEFSRAADPDLGAQLELLSFRLGQEIYAVRLTSIRQIIKLIPITTVPRAPEYLVGILSLRGMIIPVFDLRHRLRLGQTEPTRKSRIIVVAEGKYLVGLIVDEVMQVVRLPESSLEPPPSMLAAVESEFIEGIGRSQNRMLLLLALDKILVPVNGSK